MTSVARNELAQLPALILCGGLGTRLREETEIKPKPMVEIGGRPILWHIMKHYGHFGVEKFVLCLGYRGDVIRRYFLDYCNNLHDFEVDLRTGAVRYLYDGDVEQWQVVMAETGAASLTGLRVKLALRHVTGDRFLVTYGDGVADIDLNLLLEHHRAVGKLATVTAVRPSSRFGELSLKGDVVHSFREKPQVDNSWVNGGYMILERSALSLLGPDENVTLEEGVLEQLAKRGELAVYRHDGFWQCMDTLREMHLLNDLWSKGAAPWRVW